MTENVKNYENNLKPIFSGIQKFTTKDYPHHLAATLFTLGCNLRCKYCYNTEFSDVNNKEKLIENDEILQFLKKRKEVLDAIVICGGEPTIHNEILIEWIKYIKSFGYKIKLDTNGTNPKLIEKILELNLVDFISLDFKGLGETKFIEITQKNLFKNFEKSLKLILESNIEYDIRTTIHSSLLDYNDLIEMKNYLIKNKSHNWAIQKFLEVEVLDNSIGEDETDFNKLEKENFGKEFKKFEIRK